MGKFVRILEEVEAVQATEGNIDELKKLAGIVKKVTPQYSSTSYYIIPCIDMVVWLGSWLIKHPSGRLEVKSNQVFHCEYEPK